MKIEDIEGFSDILEIVENAGAFKPIIVKVIKALQSYGPEIDSLLDPIVDYVVDRKIKTINRFKANGFDEKTAVLLTLDVETRTHKYLQEIGKNKK
jgi:hypothetical protein